MKIAIHRGLNMREDILIFAALALVVVLLAGLMIGAVAELLYVFGVIGG
jgi:hypothetical protein